MTPANKLKLSFTIFCLLCVFWYLDRPFPDSSALYRNPPSFALAPNSSTATPLWSLFSYTRAATTSHPEQTGVYIIENSVEAWLARTWLADHATRSIEVQYAVWSTDKTGMLAAEALLRAADRGVKVRVIIDDLLLEAEDVTLLALAQHPNIEIRIYHPKHRVGSNAGKRLWNIIADLKPAHQAMFDKTFIVDGALVITGDRAMTNDYFNVQYGRNFHARDTLMLGKAVSEVKHHFDNFWQHPLSVPVKKVFAEHRLMQAEMNSSDPAVQIIYAQLHQQAISDPLLKQARHDTPAAFERLTQDMVWTDVDFIHGIPDQKPQETWQGNHKRSRALASLMQSAQKEIILQIPYLVLSDQALALIQSTLQRGVKIIINTNSLASSDKLPAFSVYRKQREDLLKMGVEIFEFRPDTKHHAQGVDKNPAVVSTLQAKSMLVDGQTTYIGSFHFDPRSEHLNTEVGLIIHNPQLTRQLSKTIGQMMQAGNSWNAKTDTPDQYSHRDQRFYVWLLQLFPLHPIVN